LTDLSTTVGALHLASPVIAASGTYGYGVEYEGLVDWSLVGGVSVKGLSVEPSRGHPAPRMVETPGGMLNAIGLQNIGVDVFVRDKLPRLRETGTRIIANCWGNTLVEYERIVERLDAAEGIDALELNLSSPNKREWGRLPSADPAVTAEIVSSARRRTRLPLWVKLTPNVTDVTEIARAAADAGADALTLINTLKGMAIDVEARAPVLANVSGGLSGPAIKPVALHMVYETARSVTVPIIGVGGIVSGRDAVEFLMAGASAVQVGTASLYDPAAPARIAGEIRDVLDRIGESSVAGVIDALRNGGE
jgi:dihydroorotate dehydrogenase (NAD+) catalytic subunit